MVHQYTLYSIALNTQVLSVVAQQIHSIQNAKASGMKSFSFEGTELTLDPSCAM